MQDLGVEYSWIILKCDAYCGLIEGVVISYDDLA